MLFWIRDRSVMEALRFREVLGEPRFPWHFAKAKCERGPVVFTSALDGAWSLDPATEEAAVEFVNELTFAHGSPRCRTTRSTR